MVDMHISVFSYPIQIPASTVVATSTLLIYLSSVRYELKHLITVFVILLANSFDQNSFIPKNIQFEGHPYD
jgi:hypothetical protein